MCGGRVPAGEGMASPSGSKAENRHFEAGPWRISLRKSHILKSSCERGREGGCTDREELCSVCRFSRELSALPSLPEMVFPDSWLQLKHQSGCGLVFLALEALQRVDSTSDPLKVATAEEWGKMREDTLQKIKEVVKPYDWTYTTDYRGTLLSSDNAQIQVEETEEGIDYSLLRKQETIYFYDDVVLYEDELADNGTAVLSVKIRVMASGFFVLLRFFLRVDGVLVRMNDTRFYHQAGSHHVTREYTNKEAKLSELKIPTAILTDPHKLSDILPVKLKLIHRLSLPQ